MSLSTDEVTKFYDKKQKIERNISKVAFARKYNNWIKSCLIRRFGSKKKRLLDFSGGRGEDLLKWNLHSPARYLLVDSSKESLKIARERSENMKFPLSFDLETELFDANSFDPKDNLFTKLEGSKFDIISCQFAINYYIDLKSIFRLWDSILTSKGKIIITFTNESQIKEHPIGKLYEASEFDKKSYNFYMTDTVNNVTEYFINKKIILDTLSSLKLKYSEKLSGSFSDFLESEANQEDKLLYSKMVSIQEELPYNWPVIKLYDYLVLSKESPK